MTNRKADFNFSQTVNYSEICYIALTRSPESISSYYNIHLQSVITICYFTTELMKTEKNKNKPKKTLKAKPL